jgi:aspartyl-tRNA synthetase
MGSVEMFGNFTFKEFSSKESLEEYLSAADYGTPSKPGMCFGF